jgi:hypothetical protein
MTASERIADVAPSAGKRPAEEVFHNLCAREQKSPLEVVVNYQASGLAGGDLD